MIEAAKKLSTESQWLDTCEDTPISKKKGRKEGARTSTTATHQQERKGADETLRLRQGGG